MKNLKKHIQILLLLVSISFLCAMCKKEEEVKESLQILILNKTDNIMYVTLYPKEEYRSGKLYLKSEGGGYQHSEFTIFPNSQNYKWEEVLFVTGDLNIEPHTLAAKVFDSIYISSIKEAPKPGMPAINDSVIIKFTHENVSGYKDNIFLENSIWEFSIYEWDAETQFIRKKHKEYCYNFLILEEKLIKE